MSDTEAWDSFCKRLPKDMNTDDLRSILPQIEIPDKSCPHGGKPFICRYCQEIHKNSKSLELDSYNESISISIDYDGKISTKPADLLCSHGGNPTICRYCRENKQ